MKTKKLVKNFKTKIWNGIRQSLGIETVMNVEHPAFIKNLNCTTETPPRGGCLSKVSNWVKRGLIREATKKPLVTLMEMHSTDGKRYAQVMSLSYFYACSYNVAILLLTLST